MGNDARFRHRGDGAWGRPGEIGRIVVRFDAHGSSAFGTNVVVLVSAREDEQELRPRGVLSPSILRERFGLIADVEDQMNRTPAGLVSSVLP